ncbi:hypothetical protein SFUMM280S_04721 [Streptomyces fumanus]
MRSTTHLVLSGPDPWAVPLRAPTGHQAHDLAPAELSSAHQPNWQALSRSHSKMITRSAVFSGVALGVAGVPSAAPVTAAPASTHSPVEVAAGSGDVEAAVSGSADRVLWTGSSAGLAGIKWIRHSGAEGKTCCGSFAGKFCDRKIAVSTSCSRPSGRARAGGRSVPPPTARASRRRRHHDTGPDRPGPLATVIDADTFLIAAHRTTDPPDWRGCTQPGPPTADRRPPRHREMTSSDVRVWSSPPLGALCRERVARPGGLV